MAPNTVILTLRAWAVWNRGTGLGIILGVLFAIFFLPNFAFLAIFLRSLECEYYATAQTRYWLFIQLIIRKFHNLWDALSSALTTFWLGAGWLFWCGMPVRHVSRCPMVFVVDGCEVVLGLMVVPGFRACKSFFSPSASYYHILNNT